MRFNCLAVSMVVVATMAGVALATPVEFFNVTFDDVEVPAGEFASVPAAPAVAGGTSTMATYVRDAGQATVKVHEQFVDSSNSNVLGGNGDNVVIMDSHGTYNRVEFTVAETDRPVSGLVTISLNALFDSGNQSGVNYVYFSMYNQNNAKLGDFRFRQDTGEILATEFGSAGDKGDEATFDSATWSLGEVLDISIVLDLDQNTASLLINDTLFAGGLTDGDYSLDLADGVGFGGFAIQNASNAVACHAIDNVVIGLVPEPGTMSLVISGAAVLLRKRR